jgi:hypothetical protein
MEKKKTSCCPMNPLKKKLDTNTLSGPKNKNRQIIYFSEYEQNNNK